MLQPTYPLYLANRALTTEQTLEVINKFNGTVETRVSRADGEIVEQAIAAAHDARASMRTLPPWKRAEVLEQCVDAFNDRREELAEALAIEAGKPIKDARGEVLRLIDTFKIAAGEATRFYGHFESLAISQRADGYEALVKHVPIGPCAFITPFNFPLNLVAHKVAPAIAAGCPFVLKPASATPVGALIIGGILAETDLPEGAFSILPMDSTTASPLIEDDRLKLLSFTGSHDVGWGLKAKAGKKRVLLELGGNAGCIVDEGADLEQAAARITFGAFYQSGQSCISVQRLFIHDSLYDALVPLLVEKAQALTMGDPLKETTSLGPMITEKDAIRLEQWTEEAVAHGAKLLCGGKREGIFFPATYLEGAGDRDNITCREAFGPIATLERFTDFKEAVKRVNDSMYGLQAGVFTPNLDHAFYAWNEIETGGVVINDIPSMRVDSMPYGGVKDSGLGREGVRYSMEEMSEKRLMVLNRAGRL